MALNNNTADMALKNNTADMAFNNNTADMALNNNHSLTQCETFKEYLKSLNRLYDITWLVSVYA
jgi:hypothetical protein